MGNEALMPGTPPVRKGLTTEEVKIVNALDAEYLKDPYSSPRSRHNRHHVSDAGLSSMAAQASTAGHDRQGISQDVPDTLARIAPEDQRIDSTTATPRKRRTFRYRKTKDLLDHSILKCINHFARQHRFLTEQSFSQYTTSQRRTFERDVYDYARAIGLSKAQAKASMVHARRLCGEEEYDSDNTMLDEDEVDDSPTLRVTLPASTSRASKGSYVPAPGEKRSSHNGTRKKKADETPTTNEDTPSQVQGEASDRTTAPRMTPTIRENQMSGLLGAADSNTACKHPGNTSDPRRAVADSCLTSPKADTTTAVSHERGDGKARQIREIRRLEEIWINSIAMANGGSKYIYLNNGIGTFDNQALTVDPDDSKLAIDTQIFDENPAVQQKQNMAEEPEDYDALVDRLRLRKNMTALSKKIMLKLLEITCSGNPSGEEASVLGYGGSPLPIHVDMVPLSLLQGFILSYLNMQKRDGLKKLWARVLDDSKADDNQISEDGKEAPMLNHETTAKASLDEQRAEANRKMRYEKDLVKEGLVQCFEEIAEQEYESETIDYLTATLSEALDPIVKCSLRYDQDRPWKHIIYGMKGFAQMYYGNLLDNTNKECEVWQDTIGREIAAAVARNLGKDKEIIPESGRPLGFPGCYSKISNAYGPALPNAETHVTESHDSSDSASNSSQSEDGSSSGSEQSEQDETVVEREVQDKAVDVTRGALCGTDEQSTDSEQSENTETADNEQSRKIGRSVNHGQHRGSGSSEADEESEDDECSEVAGQSAEHEQPIAIESSEKNEESKSTKQSEENDESQSSEESDQEKQLEDAEPKEQQADIQKRLSESAHGPACISQSVPRTNAARHDTLPIPSVCRICQETFPSRSALFRHLPQVHWKPEKQAKRRHSEITEESRPENTTDPTSNHKKLRKSDVRHSDGPLSVSKDFQNPMIQ
ncbi:MAG: hypothetical protein Q9188_005247 [Gyalolechia gomerana]